jgi:hypothetical protein
MKLELNKSYVDGRGKVYTISRVEGEHYMSDPKTTDGHLDLAHFTKDGKRMPPAGWSSHPNYHLVEECIDVS